MAQSAVRERRSSLICPIIHVLRATVIIAGQLMKGNKKKYWGSLKLAQESRTYTVQNIPKKKLEMKKEFLEYRVLPVMLCDVQIWALRRRKKKLQSCRQEKERRKLQGVRSDRVTNAEIRKRNNTKDIVAVAHSLKWKWGSHVAGMQQRRWVHAT